MTAINCDYCNREFNVRPYRLLNSRFVHCSRGCAYEHMKYEETLSRSHPIGPNQRIARLERIGVLYQLNKSRKTG